MRRIVGFLKAYRRLILISFLHSLILCVLTYCWMNLNFEFADEMVKVARVNEIVQYLLLDKKDPDTEALKKKLLLINCSYDKMLVPYEDDRGSGTRAVIDRRLLTELFGILRQSDSEMILLDVFLDNPSDYDSALYAELLQTHPLIMSSDLNANGSMRRPYGGLLYARAQYATFDSFLKYGLLDNDSIKYVPTIMYETTRQDTLRRAGPFAMSPEAWWLNSFIVDLSIRNVHIENNDVTMWNLGEALRYTSKEEIQSFAKGKIVVIGDFYEFDVHETLLGKQPGPLLIVNTYLGMLRGVPRINFWGFLSVLILYFASTVAILRRWSHRQAMHANHFLRSKLMKFILRYLSYLVIFSTYTVVLYIFTGKHFELILFALYFNLFEYIVRRYRKNVTGFLGRDVGRSVSA